MLEGRSHESPRERAEALILAAEGHSEQDLRALTHEIVAGLDDQEAVVRHAALDALGRLCTFRDVPFDASVTMKVASMANDVNERVRAEVAVALALLPGEHAPARTRSTLQTLLEDDSATVRREAAAALGDIADRGAADMLAARLADPDAQVCFEAAFALASLRDSRGLTVLVRALDTSRRRLDACEGLRRLRSTEAVPALRRLFGRFFLDWPDRLTVAATLYALGEQDTGERVLERARARNREERAYALSLLGSHRILQGMEELKQVAGTRGDPLRDTAVRALGELGDVSAAEILAAIAADEAAPLELRFDAVTAIDELPGEPRRAALERLAKHPHSEVARKAEHHLRGRRSEEQDRR